MMVNSWNKRTSVITAEVAEDAKVKKHYLYMTLCMWILFRSGLIVFYFYLVCFSTAKLNEYEVSPCRRDRNTICQCKEGYYKDYISTETYECRKCRKCETEEIQKQPCE